MGNRPKIPRDLSFKILYESARTCCVCRRSERPVQIHHLDKDNTNNAEQNLAALCSECHGEAHTKRELSQNLTESRIREFKAQWTAEVARRSANSMLANSGIMQALWTYIQHNRLPGILDSAEVALEEPLFGELKTRRIVDSFGVPQRRIKPDRDSATWTVYDYLNYSDRHQVHQLLCRAIDALISRARPIDLDAIWRRREIDALLKPGVICFTQRAFYFKTYEHSVRERFEKRLAFARANRIRLELHVSTRDMFGDSSVTTNYCGHRTASCLFVTKSVTRTGAWLVIHGTPIAMGAGGRTRDESPFRTSERNGRWMAVSADLESDED